MADPTDDYIDDIDRQPHQSIAQDLRDLLRETFGDDFDEDLKWGKPTWFDDSGNLFYVGARNDDHVKLGLFNGAHVDDPYNLIEGTGDSMRHIKVREDTDLDHIRDLLRRAADLHRQ